MPDGSKPSQFAAEVAQADNDPKDRQDTPAADRGGFTLGTLFRKRNGNASTEGQTQVHGQNRDLSATEKAMIERVHALESVRVGDVAIPRADIIGMDVDGSISDAVSAFASAGHSRLPVYRGDLDDPIGFIHIKDVVTELAKGPLSPEPEDEAERDNSPSALEPLVRKLLYAPPSMPVADLLLRMQAQRIHMALVIDEFGGTDGLVTIEDLIEEIVGDIRDEHDVTEEMRLRQTSGGRWESDARVELDALAERLDVDMRLEDEDADTLGGLVFSLSGRVPLRGEVIVHPDGHEFEIAEADPRRVRRVLIKLVSEQTSA